MNSFSLLFLFISSSLLVGVKTHQVRVSFEFKDSIPLECAARPLPYVRSNQTTPVSSTNNCERTLTAVMKQQLGNLVDLHEQVWRLLQQNCDPNAPFALFLYYFTRDAVQRLEQNYFLCPQEIAYLLFQESEGYFDNLAAAEPNLKFPANASAATLPWQDAFSYTKSGFATLLSAFTTQANVFFNNQMAHALYMACLTTKPYIYKPEYDKFANDLPKIIATTENAFRGLYDPTFMFPDNLFATIQGYREQAWATTLAERPNLEPANSENAAQTIAQNAVLKEYQCGTWAPLCVNNSNPSQELLDSFDP